MALISTARALDDQRFVWRVRAAALAAAVTKYGSGTANEKVLAQNVLDYPMQQNATLEALVANSSAVNNAVVVSADNTVNTDGVTDAMITTAVGNFWAPVADRFVERREENATPPL